MIIPRYSILSFANSHFFGFKYMLFSCNLWRTILVYCSRSSLLSACMRMSSMYTMQNPCAIRSENVWSIIFWNVAGELHILKNITVGSKFFLLVLNAAFHSSPSLIQTLLYPHWISSLVKYFNPWSLSMMSEINGSGEAFLIVHSFRYW